ncbi:MAG: hypothetical protein WBE37_32305 [Bryobacteraceae bacterium]
MQPKLEPRRVRAETKLPKSWLLCRDFRFAAQAHNLGDRGRQVIDAEEHKESGRRIISVHTYSDRGGLIPSLGLSAKRMELPLEKLLEESPGLGGVCGPDFNERNNILAHSRGRYAQLATFLLLLRRLLVLAG